MARTGVDRSRSSGETPDWRSVVRIERRRLKLSQVDLAARAGISPETLRKYESGARTPTRLSVLRILDALQVPQVVVRSVLLELGFAAADTLFPPEVAPQYYFAPSELGTFVEGTPWPQFVANNVLEIVAANRPAQALWGIDLVAELRGRSRAQINFLAIAAERRVTSRIANWQELAGILVGVLKAIPHSRAMLDEPGSLFADVFATYASNDPSLIAKLFALWESTPPRPAKVRWTYPVVWREPGFGEIRFLGVVSPASEPDGLGFNDWVPVDGASHRVLDEIVTARLPWRPGTSSRA